MEPRGTIVNGTKRNKIQWNLNWNSDIFAHENAVEFIIYEMAATISRPQYVKLYMLNVYSKTSACAMHRTSKISCCGVILLPVDVFPLDNINQIQMTLDRVVYIPKAPCDWEYIV